MNTKYDFGPEAGERIVYVRPVAVADLPQDVQAQAGGLSTIYALHEANGERIALVRDRKLAFALARQKPLGIQRGHAAHARAGHGLTIDVIGQIARRKYPRNRGAGAARLHLHIAAIVQFQLILDQFRGGCMADGHEKPLAGHHPLGAAAHLAQAHPGHAQRCLGAQNLLDGVVPQDFHLGVLEQPLLQDLFGAQAVAAVHQCHLGGEIGQEQRLLHGRIAAARHHDLLPAIKEPVAGGAGRNAKALELFF